VEDKAYYILEFSNLGGLVMPLLLGIEFSDGERLRLDLPAEIWRRNPHRVSKLLVFDQGKEISQIILDPEWETADADIENNYYPRRIVPSRLEAYKSERDFSFSRRDIMQDIKTERTELDAADVTEEPGLQEDGSDALSD
jgi:hypothetical protein